MRQPKLHDYAAQEAGIFLVKIVWMRTGATKKQWDRLFERIENLRSKLFNE